MPAHVDPDNLQPGTSVGVYTVVRRVGAGGFGTLYQVERDGKHYALKLSRERLGSLTPEKRKRFEDRTDREVAALKSLRHPNIVAIYAVDRWPELETGYPFLVMAFVEGERLDAWCRAGPPSLARICEVFEKIGRAVHHMHERQLFHRDLKSENVLVRSDGEPVLIDFGIARARASYRVTRQLDVVGTSTHYAPEYLNHVYSEAFERGVDFEWTAATDLHAVGYMLYEILAGRPPFSGDSEPEIWRAIQTVVPPAPSLVNSRAPGALDNVVLKLLEKDPRDRYQSGAELADAIQRMREDRVSDPAWTGPFDMPVGTPGAVVTTAARPRRGPARRADDGDIEPIRSSTARKSAPSGLDLLARTPMMQALDKGVRPGAAPAGPVVDEVPFTAPSGVRPAFVPPGTEAPGAPPPPSNALPPIPSAVMRVKEQIELGDRRGRKLPPVGVMLGLGAAAVLLSFFALIGSSSRAAQKPSSLIERVNREAASGDAVTAAGTPARAPVVASIPLPPPATAPEPSRAPVAPAAPTSAPSPADARGIDRELVARYGGRPTVPGATDTSAPGGGEAHEPEWMRRSQPLHAPTRVAAANAPLGIPTGAHIPARLLTMLDSRTVGNGPVEVKLPRPFVVRGEVVLPAGTLIYGQASSSDGRFTIRFLKLRLPDDREIDFAGLAMDRDDGRPGLAACRRVAAAAPVQGDGVAKSIAKNTAGVLLGTVTGGVAQDVVRGAGQTALSHQDSVAVGGGEALLLDPGVLFDVWVERAF